MNDRAEDLAYGRWPEILMHAGIDASYFSGKHGPCPLCGGRDRFRWSKKDGGLWVCNHCTEAKWATGFRILMEHLSVDFRGAADYVRGFFGGSTARPATAVRRPTVADEAAKHAASLRRMEEIWAATRALDQGDPVMQYLQRRVPGLDYSPRQVRYHPALSYWDPPQHEGGKPVHRGDFPAMVVRAFDPEGRFVQLHKTYLTHDGRKADVPVVKKTEKGIGVNGFAVPLQLPLGDTLGIAEGIESALGASMLQGYPVWAALNGPSMAAWDLPPTLREQIRRLVIYADNDQRRQVKVAGNVRLRSAGLHFAEQLAQRVRAYGVRVTIVKAARVGSDMADHWAQTGQRAVAA